MLLDGLKWIFSRVGIIYVIVLCFAFTCIDFKMLQMRVKLRRLNDAIPDFSVMVGFSQHEINAVHWKPYEEYFKLILRYVPDDVMVKQLLGYVDFYEGKQDKAEALFKSASVLRGQNLFWADYNLGMIEYRNQHWTQAADYFFKAVSSNPKLTAALMQNTQVYRQIFASPAFGGHSLDQEYKDAQAHAYIFLLSSLDNLKVYDKMVVIANLAFKNPDLSYKDAFAFYEGLGLLGMGQVPKAIDFFQESLNLEKNNPDVYVYLADIYRQAGHGTEARALLQISYALHQKNDPRFPYTAQADLRFF
jgi:tetratricopeptide (TPR) repeat protein